MLPAHDLSPLRRPCMFLFRISRLERQVHPMFWESFTQGYFLFFMRPPPRDKSYDTASLLPQSELLVPRRHMEANPHP